MDKYRLVGVIGQGSFGIVHKAVRLEDGCVVALKKVTKLNGRKDTDISSLITECEIQRNLDHPNIIRMLDSFDTPDNMIIVTEYAEQGELSQLMAKRRLTLPEVKKITCDLVAALNYLFDQRILHRDLKPQNILVGSDGRYKLCDFGFAKAIDIDNYLLTSVKGTPLYMAPEMIQGGAYDQKAELWSLGCIIYEMLVGKPPFMTTSIYALIMMIRDNSIEFPDVLKGDCRSFVKGLLEKEPERRLSWEAILRHPFIYDQLQIIDAGGDKGVSLTKVLSPDQEKMREKQRQTILHQKMLEYSRIIEKKKRKMEKAEKQLLASKAKCETDSKTSTLPTMQSPSVNHHHYQNIQNFSTRPQHNITELRKQADNAAITADATNLMKNLKIVEKRPVPATPTGNNLSDSSCSTESSGSDEESDEDVQTLVGTGNGDELKTSQLMQNRDFSGKGGTDLFWNGALFSLHSDSIVDKPILREEWIEFLGSTIKEVLDNPKCLCEKHFLTVLISPLRNHLATCDVIERIANVLSVPFILDGAALPKKLLPTLQSMYLKSKVLPNLLYACKVVVRRRRLESGSVEELDDIITLLSVDDLSTLDKCLRLVCLLVYMEEDFVVQFCDSVCVLKLFPMLLLWLTLDKQNVNFPSYTLAILCQLMRMIPLNSAIVEELFFGNCPSAKNLEVLWTLLRHSNPTIKSRTIRLVTYLTVNSAKTRENFIRSNALNLWKCIKQAHDSKNVELKEAASFAFKNIKEISHCAGSSSKLHLSLCQE